ITPTSLLLTSLRGRGKFLRRAAPGAAWSRRSRAAARIAALRGIMRPELVYRRLTGIGLALAVLTVAGCGGGGGGGSSPPPTPGSKVFLSDGGNHAIISGINAA